MTEPKRILVVDDEPAILDAVAYALRGEGFDVDALEEGEAALDAALSDGYDLLILDLMLPKLSGLEVCRRVRDRSDVPILILTARDSEGDRVLGLESGADDYVTKPFEVKELIARVRALLRRARTRTIATRNRRISVGGLEIEPEAGVVKMNGQRVTLTKTEFELLTALASRPDRVFTREALLEQVWEYDYLGDSRLVDVHIRRLRAKVESDPSNPTLIQTVRGYGYKLAGGP